MEINQDYTFGILGMRTGLNGQFNLRAFTKENRVVVDFKDMEHFEAFFYFLEEIQNQKKERKKMKFKNEVF